MEAVRARPPGVDVVDVDEPDGPGVLVQIRAASICKSDFAYVEMGSTHLLGHELAGVTPDGVNVAIEGIFSCGGCELCARGNANLCATMSTRALAMITHRFPLEDAVEAFRVADDTSTGALRVVLQPS